MESKLGKKKNEEYGGDKWRVRIYWRVSAVGALIVWNGRGPQWKNGWLLSSLRIESDRFEEQNKTMNQELKSSMNKEGQPRNQQMTTWILGEGGISIWCKTQRIRSFWCRKGVRRIGLRGKKTPASPYFFFFHISLKTFLLVFWIETEIYLPQRMIPSYFCWNQCTASSLLISRLAPQQPALHVRYSSYE